MLKIFFFKKGGAQNSPLRSNQAAVPTARLILKKTRKLQRSPL